MLIEFKELFDKQKELDLDIQKRHNLSYADTMEKRTLALFVELGELANATRCFKYWSNKPSEERSRVMDEYADGMHFLLSLGIAHDIKVTAYEYKAEKQDLTNLILRMYEAISAFASDSSEDNYCLMFEIYMLIAYALDMSKDDIFESYLLKLGVNYQRQKNNY